MFGRVLLLAASLTAAGAVDGPHVEAQEPPRNVTITTVPAGAEIWDADDGAVMGNAPLVVSPTSRLRLRISAPHYQTQVIVVTATDPDRRLVRLAPEPGRPPNAPAAPEWIEVISDPARAEVYATNGDILGNTPFHIDPSSLPVKLVLRAPGHRDLYLQVSGSSRQVRVQLRPTTGTPVAPPSPPPHRPRVSPASRGPGGMWTCDSSGPLCQIGAGVFGMTQQEVVDVLGRPHERDGTLWTYRYHSAQSRYGVDTRVSIRFRHGRVVEAHVSNVSLDDIICP